MSRIGRRWAIGVIVFGALAVGVLLAEAGLRVFFPQPLGISYRGADSVPVHTPDYSFHYKTSEFDIRTRFNSMGLRDREYSLKKTGNTYRILVLGDSITEALQVHDHEVYTEVLEASLNAVPSATRFEVINAGISGFGTGDELRMFEHIGEQLEPDLVILQMSLINDLSENLYCRWYRVEGGEIVSLSKEPPGLLVHFEEFLGRHSHLAQLARHVLHTLAGRKSVRLKNIARHKKKYHALLYTGEGTESDFSADWEVTFVYLKALQDRIRNVGAKMVLLLRPLDADITGDHEGMYPRNRIGEFCREQEIPLIDLTPIFQEKSGGNLYTYRFRKDSHWNPEGHRWAAEALWSFFRQTGVTP